MNIKRILSGILTTCVLSASFLSALPVSAQTTTKGAYTQVAAEQQNNLQTADSSTNEFVINNKKDFSKFMTTPEYWESNYKIMLACNIDMQDEVFDSIEIFNGQIDGCGHAVNNLSFRYFVENNHGTISNIKFNGGKLAGGNVCGLVLNNEEDGVIDSCLMGMNNENANIKAGFVWENRGKIINSETTLSVESGNDYVGGFVSKNYGTIENCVAKGFVEGKERFVGGFVGLNNGIITNCTSTGNVNGGKSYIGGFVGDNGDEEGKGIIINCTAAGDVKGDIYTGGFVGKNEYGNISGCIAKGDVHKRICALGYEGFCLGGFAGYNYGIIKECITNAKVNGKKINLNNFAGRNEGKIEDCKIA